MNTDVDINLDADSIPQLKIPNHLHGFPTKNSYPGSNKWGQNTKPKERNQLCNN